MNEDTKTFCWWMTAQRAKERGCTHHARFMGIIPGFIREDENCPLWISRSDALNWLEDALCFLWISMQEMCGEEPTFAFQIRKPIA
jgi:hypothetical protein